jgi:sugar lactone lactonase YvrE
LHAPPPGMPPLIYADIPNNLVQIFGTEAAVPEEVKLAYESKSLLGECPSWDHRRHVLYWVDIDRHIIHVFDPTTGVDRRINIGQEVGCVAPRRAGGLIAALKGGFAFVDIESETCQLLIDPESHLAGNRFNDGKCDPAGRFWAGTMCRQEDLSSPQKTGSLYCLFPDLTIRTMVSGITTSNGLAWSGDGRHLYHIDTPTRAVCRYDYDLATADISNKIEAVRIPAEMGYPDGMTIDEEGMLWIALWGGGCISRWSPKDGKLLQTVEVPAPNVTSCTFGGLHLDELYITTARKATEGDALKTNPKAGSLFRLKTDVKGLPNDVFAG